MPVVCKARLIIAILFSSYKCFDRMTRRVWVVISEYRRWLADPGWRYSGKWQHIRKECCNALPFAIVCFLQCVSSIALLFVCQKAVDLVSCSIAGCALPNLNLISLKAFGRHPRSPSVMTLGKPSFRPCSIPYNVRGIIHIIHRFFIDVTTRWDLCILD